MEHNQFSQLMYFVYSTTGHGDYMYHQFYKTHDEAMAAIMAIKHTRPAFLPAVDYKVYEFACTPNVTTVYGG